MGLARRAIASADFKATTRGLASSIAVINGIDNGTEPGMDRSLFAQSIVNKIKTRIKNDEVLGGVLLAWLHNEIKDMPRPAITNRNGVWNLTDWEQYTPLFGQSQQEATPQPEPTPEPEPVAEPTPMEQPTVQDTDKAADINFLNSVVDGSVPDILDPALADRLEQALTRNEGDAEIEALFMKAAAAYEKAMIEGTENIG